MLASRRAAPLASRLSSSLRAAKLFPMAASQSSAAKRAKTTVLSDGADLQRVMVDDCTVLATAPADGSAFVCTHHGTFHCDEAMACGMLRMLPEFADMPVVRTRDPAVIDAAHIVVDVGGTYDADARRFDHHQREFTEPFRPAPEGGATKPEDEPVRMSSAGLVYRHYGRDVIAAITGGSLPAESAEQIYQKVYERLIREVDAVDNGVEPFDGPARYRIRTGLGGRVGRLNASWNEDGGAEVENTRFKQAMHVASSELVHVVTSLVDSWLPARDIVKEAMSKRIAGGRALVLDRFCPWQEHLLDLEREGAGGAAPGEVLYVMFCDRRGGWRGQAVPKALGSFENRCPFPEAWRGLRDAELSAAVGIEDGVFVHAAGFIGGAHSEAGMTTMVEKAVAAAPARA